MREAEPIDVVQHVDMWIEDELLAVDRSEHRQLLDEDTCHNLHALARTIYASLYGPQLEVVEVLEYAKRRMSSGRLAEYAAGADADDDGRDGPAGD